MERREPPNRPRHAWGAPAMGQSGRRAPGRGLGSWGGSAGQGPFPALAGMPRGLEWFPGTPGAVN